MEEESELAMVQRHVRQGAEIITRQREVLSHLQARKQPTEEAEALLMSFEHIQRQHEEHLERINAKMSPG